MEAEVEGAPFPIDEIGEDLKRKMTAAELSSYSSKKTRCVR